MSTIKKTYSAGVDIIVQPIVFYHFIPVTEISGNFRVRNICGGKIKTKHHNQKNK